MQPKHLLFCILISTAVLDSGNSVKCATDMEGVHEFQGMKEFELECSNKKLSI